EEDPRTQQLFELARKAKLSNNFTNLALMLEHALERELGRKLVLNIDGAVAALLLTMGISPKAGNAIFGLARVAGSIAHVVEEQADGDWVRRLPKEAVDYERKA